MAGHLLSIFSERPFGFQTLACPTSAELQAQQVTLEQRSLKADLDAALLG